MKMEKFVLVLLTFFLLSFFNIAVLASWEVNLTVTSDDTEIDSETVTFAQDVNSTDGFDPDYDEIADPPLPGAPYFYVYFPTTIGDISQKLVKDVKPNGPWELHVETDTGYTVSWDVSSVPTDINLTIDGIDMRTEESHHFDSAKEVINITITGQVAEVTLESEYSTLIADGTSTSELTVTVKDANDNPISGKTITFDITPEGNGSVSNVEDKGDGTYTAIYTAGTTLGDVTITATVDDKSGTTDITLTPGPVEKVTLESEYSTLIANGTSTSGLTVTVKDANDNPISGKTIAFEITPEGNGSIGDVTDNGDGTYTATYTAGTSAETVTITATVDDKSGTTDITLTSGPAASVTVVAAPTSLVADGSSQSTITATVFDANDNPVTDETVTMTVTQGSGTVTSPATHIGDGKYEATYTAGTTVGNVTITVKATNVEPDVEGTVDITLRPKVAKYLVVEPETATAGASFSVTITPVDEDGDTTEGSTEVTLSALLEDGTPATGTLGVITVDTSGGAVTIDQTYTKAETIKIHAEDADGIESVDADTTATTVSPAAPAQVTVSAEPEEVPVAGESTIEAIVMDEFDNPVSDVTVEFTTPTEGASVEPESATTDDDGRATSILTASSAQAPNVVNITVLGTEIEDSVTVVGTADVIPPDIVPVPLIPEVTAGEDLVITATITDNVGVESASVYYRVGGIVETKAPVPMSKDSGDTYTAAIPGSNVTVKGLAYYIKAVDLNENESKWKSLDDMQNVTVTGSITSLDETGTDKLYEEKKWYTISIPLEADNPRIEDIFTEWAGFSSALYDPDIRDYDMDPSKEVVPGVGLFALANTQDETLTVTGSSTNITEDYEISLPAGWNLIGLPFCFGRYWNDDTIRVKTDTYDLPISEATSNPRLIHPVVYWYDHTYTDETGAHYRGVEANTGNALKPFVGYWILAFRDITLSISPEAFGPDDAPVPPPAAPPITLSQLPTIDNIVPPQLPFDLKYIPGGALGRNGVGQNYPNPFNPETWFPYQLKEDADNVTINIYNTDGKLVRTLDLGSKSRGLYIKKDRAAYWDGTNDFGEKLATGMYFYQLKSDSYKSSVFKMVILK